MPTELRTYPVPNLVQGVSQQTSQLRRDTQCEEQFDCINSPVNGAEARPGFELVKFLAMSHFEDAFFWEVKRGTDEHYLVVITNNLSDGDQPLRVYDLNTGLQCVVTYTAPLTYVGSVGRPPKDWFVATTLNDVTFIANKFIPPTITTDTSPQAVNEGIVHFKAGAYSVTYQIAVTYAGQIYTFVYTTPDNSTSGNAYYIGTNILASTFFKALTGTTAATTFSGAASDGTNEMVGAAPPGGGGGSVTGAITLTSLGFTVSINGNVLRIRRDDSTSFKIDVSDGVGDTYIFACKDAVQAFTDLPKSCFLGFTIKVKGTNKQSDDDYWVQYKGEDGRSGFWEEVVAPGTPLTLDVSTSPHELINTGVGTFVWKQPPWGARVSGDGVNSSKDPSFIGKPIYDMFFAEQRLAILTEGSCVWSKSRNPFVFFPSSAQTIEDTDPVDVQIAAPKEIALLRRAVLVNEAQFLWAETLQFRITTGQNGTDPFKQDSVDAKPSSRYEFAPKAYPAITGDSVYFATEPGPWATIRDLTILDGKPRGTTDVTAHVKSYIPSGVRHMAPSDTLNFVALLSEGAAQNLFFYNFLLGPQERLQSAWNTWRLPSGCTVLFTFVRFNYLFLVVQRSDGVMLLRANMAVDAVDDDAETNANYAIRLDLRRTEAAADSLTYDAGTDRTTITLPALLTDAEGSWLNDAADCPVFVVQRVSNGDEVRGKQWKLDTIAAHTITVVGDCHAQPLYIGYRIRAERLESTPFYVKSGGGPVPFDRLTVSELFVSYAKTGYFRAELAKAKGSAVTQSVHMSGRLFGTGLNVVGSYPIVEGILPIPIHNASNEFAVRLVNDSFLPSRWTSQRFTYEGNLQSVIARPATATSGGTF